MTLGRQRDLGFLYKHGGPPWKKRAMFLTNLPLFVHCFSLPCNYPVSGGNVNLGKETASQEVALCLSSMASWAAGMVDRCLVFSTGDPTFQNPLVPGE